MQPDVIFRWPILASVNAHHVSRGSGSKDKHARRSAHVAGGNHDLRRRCAQQLADFNCFRDIPPSESRTTNGRALTDTGNGLPADISSNSALARGMSALTREASPGVIWSNISIRGCWYSGGPTPLSLSGFGKIDRNRTSAIDACVRQESTTKAMPTRQSTERQSSRDGFMSFLSGSSGKRH
jgi:hypothetical protein